MDVFVTDSGPGIDEKSQEKIFLPFFTTKKVGKGTGLGLSISKTLIEANRGKIRYESDRGGACFVISLPTAEPQGLQEAG